MDPTQATPEQIRAAAGAIGYSLHDKTYAVVGGAACSLLGSSRETNDVDIVVPQGATRDTRRMLKDASDYFYVEKKTLHTYYTSDPKVEIEIIAPPSLFREPFDSNTPVIMVDGIRILKPSLILNAKCNSILGRASGLKKTTDATDIKFCLWWCSTNNACPTTAEVPRATKEFVEWFIHTYGEKEFWTNAGYHWDTWSF